MALTTNFGQINFITTNIVEIIIKENIEITLELVDEYDALMAEHFFGNYAVLVNKINNYRYAYEALLCIGSAKNLTAVAVINYGTDSDEHTKNLQSVRHMDNLNIKEFSGLELGRENALAWLNQQLAKLIITPLPDTPHASEFKT